MMVRGLLLRAGLRQMEVKVSSAHRGRFRNEFGTNPLQGCVIMS